jgi:hypothetical protein
MQSDSSYAVPSSDASQEVSGRASDVYSRILLAKGIGYPLWIPEPPPQYEKEGVSIGDVGLITFDGRFDILFNVFSSSADDNENFAPPTLQRLPQIQSRDIIWPLDVHSPGSVFKSSSVTSLNTNVQPTDAR